MVHPAHSKLCYWCCKLYIYIYIYIYTVDVVDVVVVVTAAAAADALVHNDAGVLQVATAAILITGYTAKSRKRAIIAGTRYHGAWTNN